MTISVYYFCADYRDDYLTQTTAGTVKSSKSPFDDAFPAEIRERIAAAMEPPRPADLVFVRSLSLLATREGEQ